MLNNVDQLGKASEFGRNRSVQELETDLSRYRSTVETQLGLLPSTTATSTDSSDETSAN